MTGAIKTAERRVAAKTLVHGGGALMAWCVGNAKMVQRDSATLVSKGLSGVGKVDPLLALFDAVHLMALNPVAKGLSVYEERGFRYL
ncbi:hypothetical protein [Paenacidovorax monticola]|uniref:Uncharacterized protein n=1 Tax=Paenacidovorax monticola TaxID=1926868 RepID=A0A7H0HJ20_9BURK|nr:hypothetical protein [Paenacidovorax monticola]QNP60536.1 hypothetical protein H9L24_06805 [Paenacidovorax monticola]